MMTEVEARINAVLKRKPNVWNEDTSFFRLSPQTTFNSNLRQLVINGEMRKLTTNEARLLKLLCLRINNCAEKEYLCKGIWGFYDLTKNRYLDRDIVKIRKYLAPDSQLRVVNEFGVGFILTN
ncbi:MAG: winged helix-turn-helix domain-containing protein [Bacteroidales bacterium]|nr:winged helix-turn-helix domain-containing protein [Bacteroidales bacterium]